MKLITEWPKDWPWYKQACFGGWDKRCDVIKGPCACGAWHDEGEFEFDGETLYRYGEPVPCRWETMTIKARAIALNGLENTDDREEAEGILLFVLSQYNEDRIVDLFVEKFCKDLEK